MGDHDEFNEYVDYTPPHLTPAEVGCIVTLKHTLLAYGERLAAGTPVRITRRGVFGCTTGVPMVPGWPLTRSIHLSPGTWSPV
jgi:hypothetical protein